MHDLYCVLYVPCMDIEGSQKSNKKKNTKKTEFNHFQTHINEQRNVCILC